MLPLIRLVMQVDAGEEFLVMWNTPCERWTNVKYDHFELSFNGKSGVPVKLAGDGICQ